MRGAARRSSASRWLLGVGGLLLLGAAAYAGYALLNVWLLGKDRYLVADDVAPMPFRYPAIAGVQTPVVEAATPNSGVPADTQASTGEDSRGSGESGLDGGPLLNRLATALSRSAGALSPQAEAMGASAITTPTPQPTPVSPAAAVRIRIPAIGVDRSIVELPLTYDSRSKTWKRDYARLFRRAGKDLVGHLVGSALPGQPGNMILVGHNYGYGYNGVFLRVGRLKAGQQVEIVSATGQTFTYLVKEVKHIPWSRKNEQELVQHLAYLTLGGPERLTLVTCGGSDWEPFPDRVYVVAEPAR